MSRLIFFASILALAACAETREPEPTPTEDGGAYNMIDPLEIDAGAESSTADGQWVSGTIAGRPALLFGPANSEALFSMRCEDGDGLTLTRTGIVPAGGLEMMIVSVEGANARYAVRAPEDAALPTLVARVPPADSFLVALRGDPGAISVRIGDRAPLVLPADPRIGELVRSCAR